MPRSIPKRYVRDPSPNPTSRRRGGETQKTQKTKKASSRSPRRAPKIRACAARRASSAACALRDAAGEAWDAGERLDAVALSLVATAAAPRGGARGGDESPKREGAEGDAGGFDAEDVAEASRRLDAALKRAAPRGARGERRGNDGERREKLEF